MYVYIRMCIRVYCVYSIYTYMYHYILLLYIWISRNIGCTLYPLNGNFDGENEDWRIGDPNFGVAYFQINPYQAPMCIINCSAIKSHIKTCLETHR